MKYEQPYGVSDPNASYINGNPATGTMGSIPPAASIENPQREIVNLIADSGMTPSDADLHQLARAVQGSHLFYAVDNGTANALAINVVPALLAYAAGQRWTVKVFATNTGPSVININSLGARHIVYPLGGEMKGGELQAGGIVTLVDDGVNLQLTNVAAVTGTILTAPKTYYVNASIGSDTLYDGTTATVSGTSGPFATHQRALNAAYSWNQNGFGITILTANGNYPPFQCQQPPNGAGGISLVGDTTTPSNVVIHATSGEAIVVTADSYQISGMTVQSDAPGAVPHLGAGLRVEGAATVITNMNFGACASYHIVVAGSGSLVITGRDSGNPGDFIQVSGDTPTHMGCIASAILNLGGTTLTTIGNRNITTWALCQSNAVLEGVYLSQTLGGTVTGQKYNVALNGVINTLGSGVNYFPGTVAGAASAGGQYG